MVKKAASTVIETTSALDASKAGKTTRKPVPIKVGMHVLGAAATDPRVLREATALIEAGYAVSIVDIEEEGSHQREENLRGVSLKHVLMPRAFFSTRFDKWALFRVTKMFSRTTR